MAVMIFSLFHEHGQEQTMTTSNDRVNDGPARLTVRVPDALHMLGIGRTKFYELLGAGEIETIKIGKATLIVMESLHGFVERQRAGGS